MLTDLLDAGRDQDVAVISEGVSLTYGELRVQARNGAASLSQAGLRHGERVLVVLPNEASFVTAIFATWRAGGVVVPIDYRSPAEQIVRLARDCRAAAIFCNGLVLSKLGERLGDAPSVRLAVVKEPRPLSAQLDLDIMPYGDAIAFRGPPPELSIRPGELAALMYTSGSTGRPKGVMHSHESLVSSLIFTRGHLAMGREDRVLISFPLYHLFSFRVLLVHLMVGGTVVAATDIYAGLKRAPETRPNALILVPAACALVVERFGTVLAECAATLRRVCIGSAAISPALHARLQRLLPDTKIYIPYGMTEARIGFLEPVEGRTHRRLCALDPNLELQVLDDHQAPVGKGIGEIVLRGPALMIGYWHNTEEENERIRSEGFRTRDLMEVTETGDQFLVGRLDDVISVGGEKVFPSEVEAVLLAHPKIVDARVSGEADPRGVRGQIVGAMIVLEPHANFDRERESILAHCRTQLEPYKLPGILRPVSEIRRNEMGKVARVSHELRAPISHDQ